MPFPCKSYNLKYNMVARSCNVRSYNVRSCNVRSCNVRSYNVRSYNMVARSIYIFTYTNVSQF